jgi:enoyl-CoA hydratase/carnithine racemase
MIHTTHRDSVGTITIDRPSKRNALTTEMLSQLGAGVTTLIEAHVSVIVVRSSSDYFSAGADIAEWANPTPTRAADMSRIGVTAFAALAAAPMPTIAVIDGVAIGGGLELALACDLRIATHRTRLGLPELGLGNVPAYGGISRLVAAVGVSHAQELLFTAETIDGARAASIGLVNWAVDDDQLDQEAARIIDLIVGVDPHAASLTKALTGGSSIDGPLSAFTSQSDASRSRKTAFLNRRAATSTPTTTPGGTL